MYVEQEEKKQQREEKGFLLIGRFYLPPRFPRLSGDDGNDDGDDDDDDDDGDDDDSSKAFWPYQDSPSPQDFCAVVSKSGIDRIRASHSYRT